MTELSIFSLALSFFLIANPIGNIPPILSVVREFPFARQRTILLREAIFSLMIALFFQFIGETFMELLDLSNYTFSLCGGILLFIVALEMIFPLPKAETTNPAALQEPFIVPIATPLITGAGLMSAIMLYASRSDISSWTITGALLIAWVGVIGTLISAPYLQKILGKRGLLTLEQLMGMILAMISMQLLVTGVKQFLGRV